ncbi:MAG TPA: ATP-binding protein [Solirubrobacterales bacterium]|nr:ATP-binding protein [Solirubrobacterales bacterium]
MSHAVAIDLPLEPASARRAREHLEPFREALDETAFFDLRLLVSELMVEALNGNADGENGKAHGRVALRAELRDDRVRVEVAQGDQAFRLPARRPEPGDVGWALYLVARLSNRWGLRRGPQQSLVWLEVN